MAEVKQRESNMELLRMVAMLMIVVMHLSYICFGNYCGELIDKAHPAGGFIKLFVIFCCYGRMALFVLLSGWYAIHPKKKSLANLLFQVFFYSLLSYTLFIAFDPNIKFTWHFLIHVLITDDYWFVPIYLTLFFFAPVLNSFVEKASKRQFAMVLGAAIVMQSIYGWLSPREMGFKDGASPASFFILYLLARYTRLYATRLHNMSKKACAAWFFGIIFAATTITFYGYYTDNEVITDTMFKLSSIFTISSGLLIVLFFSKIKKVLPPKINRIAKSVFAVFLIHCFPYFMGDVFLPTAKYIYESYNGITFAALNVGFVVAIYVGSILIDQLRIKAWNIVERRIWK